MIFMIYNKEVEKKIEKLGFNIEDVGLDGRPPALYQGTNWWNITYGDKDFSLYYDSKDIMGAVGAPYYEIYNGNDTDRFLENDGNEHQDDGFRLVRHLKSIMDAFKLDQKINPENWL